MSLTTFPNFYPPENFNKQYGSFELIHFFRKKIASSVISRSRSFSFGSRCSTNFQSIFNWFTLNIKLKHDDSENIDRLNRKTDRLNTGPGTEF